MTTGLVLTAWNLNRSFGGSVERGIGVTSTSSAAPTRGTSSARAETTRRIYFEMFPFIARFLLKPTRRLWRFATGQLQHTP